MKKIPLILSLILIISLLAGCAGTPVVYYTDCTCPADVHTVVDTPVTPEVPVADGALKTGLYIGTSVKDSKSAAADADGEAKYDVTMVAVLVDENGVIQDCIIDGISTSIKFDANGAFIGDLSDAPQTKNELGDAYGMRKASKIGAEWNEQAAAFADFAVGMTVEKLRNGAISESGYAHEGSDLAASATINLGGYAAAIEEAVNNAQYLGAQAGDTLKLAAITKIDSSTTATAESDGNAQLDVDVIAMTMKDGVITSATIDSVQAKVSFDGTGTITSDVTAPVATKNELGENYGMVAWGNAKAEWNEQAAAFAAYITGKTPAEVAGIAITEATKPADADLAASVTISIIGFQNLIAKAAK